MGLMSMVCVYIYVSDTVVILDALKGTSAVNTGRVCVLEPHSHGRAHDLRVSMRSSFIGYFIFF